MRLKLFSVWLSLLLLSACVYVPPATPDTAHVHHVVLIWLKDSGNPQQRERIIKVSRTFAAIKGVRRVTAGTALPSQRKIVDSSFDVAIIMDFDSEKAMQGYLEHIDHIKALNNIIKPLTDRIVVYDFVD